MTDPMKWMDLAPCRGRDRLFYGPAGERPEARQFREAQAGRICAGCPFQSECLEDELGFAWKADHIHGFRAGMGEDQRRALFRERSPRRQPRAAAWYYDLVPA